MFHAIFQKRDCIFNKQGARVSSQGIYFIGGRTMCTLYYLPMLGKLGNACNSRKKPISIPVRLRKQKDEEHNSSILQSFPVALLCHRRDCRLRICSLCNRAGGNACSTRDPASIRILLQVLTSNVMITMMDNALTTHNAAFDSGMALAR